MASDRRRRLRALSFVLVTSALALAPATSNAQQEPSAADKETARGLMDEGHARRDRHDLKAALESFQAADALMHVPTTALEVAKTQVSLGLLVEARGKVLDMLRAPAKPNEPHAFQEARLTAQSMSDDLEARIPAIHLILRGLPEGSTPTVAIDGANIPPAALMAWRKLNPGHHDIVAHASASEKHEDVTVRERDKKEIVLDFSAPAPVAVGATPGAADTTTPDLTASTSPPPPQADTADTTPSSVPWKTIEIAGFGVGAVGIIVGSITGIMSISDTNSAKAFCNSNNLCDPRAHDDIASAKSTGTVSTIAFVVGGVGVAVGVVSLVMNGRTHHDAPPPAAARIEPWIGAGTAGLRGVF